MSFVSLFLLNEINTRIFRFNLKTVFDLYTIFSRTGTISIISFERDIGLLLKWHLISMVNLIFLVVYKAVHSVGYYADWSFPRHLNISILLQRRLICKFLVPLLVTLYLTGKQYKMNRQYLWLLSIAIFD